MKSLNGKTALVTGGAGGIGRAIVVALANEGANVALVDRILPESAQTLCDELRQRGVKAKPYVLDITHEHQVAALADAVLADLGPTSIIVNCAGITRDKSFSKMTRELWDQVLEVNLSAVFTVTQAFLNPLLEQGWGRIINISSVVGQQGNFGQANYAAAKGGLIAFTKTLARELARKSITVNAVAPGFIETEMTKGLSDVVKKAVCDGTPVGRFGTPEEVAAAVTFLASPSASYITGQVLGVNGGMYM